MSDMLKIMGNDRFAFDTVGLELVEANPGNAKARMQVRDCHLNGIGYVQGGAIFTLADFALAAAANAHGVAAVTVNASITFLQAASEGILWAEAKEENLGSRLATYSVRVTDHTDTVIAIMQGTVYRKKEMSFS